MIARSIAIAAAAALLWGCASTPQIIDTGPTPKEVIAGAHTEDPIHWGGQIIKVKNLRDRTLIEVLAHPLDAEGRPQINLGAQGRFIVDRRGFLEPEEYSSNRLLEVKGTLNGFTEGRVGDAPYRYPVVAANMLQLWERPVRSYGGGPWVTPRIGIGVGTGSSGTSVGGGVGIGIGF